jgi:hypothetical protein
VKRKRTRADFEGDQAEPLQTLENQAPVQRKRRRILPKEEDDPDEVVFTQHPKPELPVIIQPVRFPEMKRCEAPASEERTLEEHFRETLHLNSEVNLQLEGGVELGFKPDWSEIDGPKPGIDLRIHRSLVQREMPGVKTQMVTRARTRKQPESGWTTQFHKPSALLHDQNLKFHQDQLNSKSRIQLYTIQFEDKED